MAKLNKKSKLGMAVAAGTIVAGAVAAGIALSKKKNRKGLGKVVDKLKKEGKRVNEKVAVASKKAKKVAKVIKEK